MFFCQKSLKEFYIVKKNDVIYRPPPQFSYLEVLLPICLKESLEAQGVFACSEQGPKPEEVCAHACVMRHSLYQMPRA